MGAGPDRSVSKPSKLLIPLTKESAKVAALLRQKSTSPTSRGNPNPYQGEGFKLSAMAALLLRQAMLRGGMDEEDRHPNAL